MSKDTPPAGTLPVHIRVLLIGFEQKIAAWELPAFRGAVSSITGYKHLLFHNHRDKKGYRYGYPLIQYKRIREKPALLCIEEGVDEVHHFFEEHHGVLPLGDREYEIKVENIRLNRFTMQTWDRSFRYRLLNWLPLNQNNYEKYHVLTDDVARTELLNDILFGNILSFAKGIGWLLDKEKMKVRIHDILRRSMVKVKGVPRETFTLEFSTNVFLPNYIGLGRNVSLGFGMVRSVRE